jgi:GNAT superfamily N-acetyltransferase
MPAITCEACQVELAADDFDAHVGVVLDHYTAEHPQFGLTERQVRNYLERMPMLSPATARLDEVGEVDVVPLSVEHVDDVTAFFDRDAFAGNPAWASCYCMAHHVPGGEEGDEWGERSWRDNRNELAERIRAGTTQGVVAYCDGQLVAWCNASPRCQYPGYVRDDGADDTTGVVACFVVAPTHRGHGLARRLLAAAIEQFPSAGITAVEAHPANDPTWAGAAYRGTIPLYVEQGFAVAHEGERTTVVRRDI